MVSRLIILDKNFLQSEDKTTPRLRALAHCGCEFVLTDTLIYEFCSDANPRLWPSLQRKLFPFADRLHLWFHTAKLLRREVCGNRPIDGPEDGFATRCLHEWFRSGQVYVPENLRDIVNEAHQQREVDTMEKVAPMARSVGWLCNSFTTDLRRRANNREDINRLCLKFVDDKSIISWTIKACHGNPDSQENYIPDAADRINVGWFAYHHARVTLALICVFLKKYGLSDNPGKKFPNTKLDADYLALLHYADGLASDETTGDMADMSQWLFGNKKKFINTTQLRLLLPTEDAIRRTAYHEWERTRRTHGHDLADWYKSESDLYEVLWEKLELQPQIRENLP